VIHVGDVVLYVHPGPLPIPRGKIKAYSAGVVVASDERFTTVEDVCKEVNVVYTRFVRVVKCRHE
jgi:hypothetical protein